MVLTLNITDTDRAVANSKEIDNFITQGIEYNLLING